MNKNQIDWINGLDQSGWIAAALFVVFFAIAAITVVMMLKLRHSNKKSQGGKTLEDTETTTPKQKKPAPTQTRARKPEKKEDDSNPVEEAEVFLTYGLNKQAIDLLEKYLKENPSDKTAKEMLTRAQSET